MRPWLLIVAFAFSIGAAMAEDLPPAVQKAIAEAKRDCKTVAIEKGFLRRHKDINGDGRPDFVLDYESFTCDGLPRAFCGSIGCLTQVFASLPNGAYAKVFDDNVSGGSIFVTSGGDRRSLLACPALPVGRTRLRFATSSNHGTARPSWICQPREQVQRPEQRMQNRSVRSERSSRKSSPCTARAKWDPSPPMRSCASTSPLSSHRYGTVQWRETTVRSTQTRLRTKAGTRRICRASTFLRRRRTPPPLKCIFSGLIRTTAPIPEPKSMDAPRGSNLEDRRHFQGFLRRMKPGGVTSLISTEN